MTDIKRLFMLSILAMLPLAVFAQEARPTEYRVGPGDQLLIRASNAPDLNEKQFRVDPEGFLNAPTIGRMQAAGLTLGEVEQEVNKRLGVLLQQPDAAVSIFEYQSQPVSLFGEIGAPGVHQLQGRKTLIEMIALAGGVRPDAGPALKITRRLEYGRIPLPGAADDPTGKYSIATLQLKPLVNAQTPEMDIAIQPYDVISVPRAELIYVAGDVGRSGPITLSQSPTLSVLEALSATGGVTKTADTKRARILRVVPGNAVRDQVPVNIADIMKGKISDVQLVAGDILVVPSSNTKKAAQRALESAIQMGTVILSSGLINGTL